MNSQLQLAALLILSFVSTLNISWDKHLLITPVLEITVEIINGICCSTFYV